MTQPAEPPPQGGPADDPTWPTTPAPAAPASGFSDPYGLATPAPPGTPEPPVAPPPATAAMAAHGTGEQPATGQYAGTPVADGAADEFAPVGDEPEADVSGPKRRRRWPVAVAAGVLLALLLSTAGYTGLRAWYGWGITEPEQVVPAGVAAFARVDLDPGYRDRLAAAKV